LYFWPPLPSLTAVPLNWVVSPWFRWMWRVEHRKSTPSHWHD
jgi:hypothetical protein